MRVLSCVAATTLLMSGWAWAGSDPTIVTNTKRDGKQVITTFQAVTPPKTTDGTLPSGDAKGVVLEAKDWRCGRFFTDQENRRWVLVSGPALSHKPAGVAGWLIESKDRGLIFVTASGSVFRPVGNVIVGPAFQLNIAPKN